MVKHTKIICWLLLGGVCANLSCNLININRPVPSGSPANTPALINQNTDTVSVEIFIVRLAPHQNELLQQLWREVDEQSLSPQLRRELFAEGFRVGVLGSLLSPALAELLTISADGRVDVPWGEFQEVSAADAAREPMVTRSMRNLLPTMWALVKVFNTPIPELSLFREENGMMHSQTYTEAIGSIRVRATANGDGSAQIQIVPELEHGVAELRLLPRAGMVVHDTSRPRYSFESLMVSQRLLPGQWLIIGTTAPNSAGVGKTFFVRRDSGLEQRLVAIRLINAIPATTPTLTPLTVPSGTETIMPERN